MEHGKLLGLYNDISISREGITSFVNSLPSLRSSWETHPYTSENSTILLLNILQILARSDSDLAKSALKKAFAIPQVVDHLISYKDIGANIEHIFENCNLETQKTLLQTPELFDKLLNKSAYKTITGIILALDPSLQINQTIVEVARKVTWADPGKSKWIPEDTLNFLEKCCPKLQFELIKEDLGYLTAKAERDSFNTDNYSEFYHLKPYSNKDSASLIFNIVQNWDDELISQLFNDEYWLSSFFFTNGWEEHKQERTQALSIFERLYKNGQISHWKSGYLQNLCLRYSS